MTKKDDYQAMSARLEDILGLLQSPDIAIDEAVKLHEEGTALIEKMKVYLETAENTVKALTAE